MKGQLSLRRGNAVPNRRIIGNTAKSSQHQLRSIKNTICWNVIDRFASKRIKLLTHGSPHPWRFALWTDDNFLSCLIVIDLSLILLANTCRLISPSTLRTSDHGEFIGSILREQTFPLACVRYSLMLAIKETASSTPHNHNLVCIIVIFLTPNLRQHYHQQQHLCASSRTYFAIIAIIASRCYSE